MVRALTLIAAMTCLAACGGGDERPRAAAPAQTASPEPLDREGEAVRRCRSRVESDGPVGPGAMDVLRESIGFGAGCAT